MAGIPFIRDFKFDYGTAMEVTPLIRRVVAKNPNPFTFKGTGTYIIGHGNVAVVDPGPDDQEHIDAVLRALRGETVTHILVTHTHVDHVPATPALARATGAKVYSYGPHPTPEGVTAEQEGDFSFAPDVKLNDGDVIQGAGWNVEAVHTPGHISNHLCFAVKEDKALLSGDHVMGWPTTSPLCASCCRATRASTSRRTAPRSAIPTRSCRPISSIGWAARRRSSRASRTGRRPFRRWWQRTMPTRLSICIRRPAARCWPISSRW